MALQLPLKEGVEVDSIKSVKAALEARFPDYKLKFPLDHVWNANFLRNGRLPEPDLHHFYSK